MTLLVLFVSALIVQATVGAAFAGPAYPDAYHYVNVARELATGHGLSVDHIWNFVDVGGRLPHVAQLPIPSNGHWTPLAALVQVPFGLALGATPVAASLPIWIIGALAAPLTYLIGRDAGFGPRPALIAGTLAAVPGGLTLYFGQPEKLRPAHDPRRAQPVALATRNSVDSSTYTRPSMKSRTVDNGDEVQLGRPPVPEGNEEIDPRMAIALLGAHEQERARLAEELHDGPAQALANAIFQTEIVDRAMRDDPAAARLEVASLRSMLERELDTLRGYINQLRPSLDEAEGMDEALRDSVSAVAQRAGVEIEISLNASVADLHPAARTVVLRVAQESLRNIAKHAAARRAWLSTNLLVIPGGTRWQLEVGDDGRGFDLDSVAAHPNKRHFGLRFMRERSELLGSQLTITTRPAAGTVVRLTIEQGGE
ncbi:hypothetical protein BH24CHL5_BH24CHL5_00840 [soil metagenome]